MAKKKPLLKAEAERESVCGDLITRWLGLAGVLLSSALFLFNQDSAQIKITVFYAAVSGAFALWLSDIFERRVKVFSARNWALLFPFALYFLYTVISFFVSPYVLARLGSLIRFLAYSALFVTVIFAFNNRRAAEFIKYLLAAAWVVSVYGAVQILDKYLLPGIDVFKWTDFFHERIFSTIANPNFLADFCLFSFFAALGSFLIKPSKSLAVLMILLVLNIAFTLSKGAWLALAAGLALFGFIYFNFFSAKYKYHRIKYNLLISAVLLCAFVAAGVFTAKRMQSVNFRLSTWRSAVEMVEAAPAFGTGKGSFRYIYTAYKRPEIFYMEGLHNGETQHAENYLLEQTCELGIVGLGLFLLLLIWQSLGFLSRLKKLCSSSQNRKDALLLLTCFTAPAVIYLHNIVDVSIYFVSTAYFLTVFNGILFVLNFGPLETSKPQEIKASSRGKFFKFIYVLFAAFVLFIICVLAREFYEMSSPALKDKAWYFYFYWFFFLISAGYSALVFLRGAWLCRRTASFLIFALAAALIYLSFQPFRSDFYAAAGAGLAGRNNPAAPSYYYKALKLNPFSPSLYQFSGIVFQNRADLAKKNRPYEGDEPEGLFNDYDRALKAYKKSLALIPNDTMIHYNLGSLYHDMAKAAARRGNKKEAQEYYNLAEASLKKSLLLDPVYDNAYYQLANIALEHNDYRLAANWVNLYIQGPEEVSNPLYIAKHRNDPKAQNHLRGIRAAGGL